LMVTAPEPWPWMVADPPTTVPPLGPATDTGTSAKLVPADTSAVPARSSQRLLREPLTTRNPRGRELVNFERVGFGE